MMTYTSKDMGKRDYSLLLVSMGAGTTVTGIGVHVAQQNRKKHTT